MTTQYIKNRLAVVDFASETQSHVFNPDDLINMLTVPACAIRKK
jgi:hypothetical protein